MLGERDKEKIKARKEILRRQIKFLMGEWIRARRGENERNEIL
jgi:hypothetical protein